MEGSKEEATISGLIDALTIIPTLERTYQGRV